MKKVNILYLLFCFGLLGCSSLDLYPTSASYAQIKEKQILDPLAPVNNAGVVNDLEGKYGEKVIKSYQKSSYEPPAGRSNQAKSIISSGSK